MKLHHIFAVIVLVAGSALPLAGQSRRDSPVPQIEKTNKRPEPSPTVEIPKEEAGSFEDTEVVKVDTQLVTIPVRVMDRKNRFVGGLAAENFKVFENGVEQEIAHFSNEAQPFTVALVLDMSYSATFKIEDIQAAALAFVELLRPNDKVMVVSFDQEVRLLCEPTADRKEIHRAIMGTKISTGTSLYEAVDLVMNKRFRNLEGRKAIILFTDGVDTTSQASHDHENLSDAMELDALIFPIRYDTYRDVQAMKNTPIMSQPGQLPRTPPAIPSKSPGSPLPFPIEMIGMPDTKGTTAEEYARAEEYLDQLAIRTGGQTYLASSYSNLNKAFANIASELREFYSLGYYPSAESPAGTSLRIKVKVDKPNVAVRARDSYIVGKAEGQK